MTETATATEAIRHLLLRVLADPDGGHAAEIAGLDAKQAAALVELAQRTRTAPLLHRALGDGDIPVALHPQAKSLAEYAKAQSLLALGQARALVEAVQLLREAGIEAVALKGLPLAFGAYPAPQLRVLRDLDLLVEPAEAERAQHILLDHPAFERAPWAGRYGTEHGHQMPEIIHSATATIVELHHRLNARNWPQDRMLAQRMRESAEGIELLGESIRVPVARHNLLHLVEHATLHHAFANGPLVLADLHFLAGAGDLDWAAIEAEARELGLERSLHLVGALAARNGAKWALARDYTAPADALLAAERAMLIDEESHRRLAQLRRLEQREGGAPGVLAALGQVFRPNDSELARLSGRTAESGLRWLGYPRWLAEKGGRFLGGRGSAEIQNFAASYSRLVGWLSDDLSD